MARVYISSTYSDLIEARSLAYQTLRSLGHDVVAMEDYVATDQRPLDKCIADVAQSDIYIGIFAWRYGYIPANHEQSITELEFRTAVESGIPCLLFLLKEEAPWPRNLIDRDPQRIETFRAELGRDYLASLFSSIDDLASKVSVAVTKHLGQRTSQEAEISSTASHIISETAAMTFIDLMRLLGVSFGNIAFKYNIDRYDEFVDIASDHLDDLKSQLGRYATSLSKESIETSRIIEMQLKWAFRRLRPQPEQPQIDRQLVRTMRRLSADIHKFCLRSMLDRYQAESSCVQRVISEVMSEISDREANLNLDELWQIRLGIQSEVLKKCPVAKKQLGSIGNDAVYDLSFYYFAIDHYLLTHAIK